MSIEQEIRDEIDNIKQLKIDVGDINNHLNALEGLCRDRSQNAVDEAYKKGYDKGYKDKINNADENYQRGLDDAWEAVRKIICDEKLNCEILSQIFNTALFSNIFKYYSASEVIKKLNDYEGKADIKQGCNGCAWRYESSKDVHCKDCARNHIDRYEKDVKF